MLVRALVLGTSVRKIHVHVRINRHTRARTYSRQYIFSSVPTSAHACAHTHILFSSAHFLISTHKYSRARSRTRGVLGQGTPPLDPLGPLSQTPLNARARV